MDKQNVALPKFKGKTITLCGSTRFKLLFEEVAVRLSWDGHLIFRPEVYSHFLNQEVNETEEAFLDELHKQKIARSDEIFVINKGQYIGSSTRSEIKFAKQLELRILYYEPQTT